MKISIHQSWELFLGVTEPPKSSINTSRSPVIPHKAYQPCFKHVDRRERAAGLKPLAARQVDPAGAFAWDGTYGIACFQG